MESGCSALLPLLSAATAAAAVWSISGASSSTHDDLSTRLDAAQKALAAAAVKDASFTTSSTPSETDADWLASLQTIMPAVVSIRIMKVRAFDDDRAGCSVATGFIVDSTRGLILTNRHVVTPGPVVADAVFVNHEEVALVPIYRDPVHDFGFFRFDPSRVRFQTQLPEIPLRPDLAQVGTPIRVVGNDNAEKVQILPGILAKLDRAAPQYGLTGYNDFNTFYYAAASSTSGGSSGSPVLNAQGMAIALNAGAATNAASSYYLPLDRVVRALELLQQGHVVTRGTWQTIFRHVPFDEARQLGLTAEVEQAIRAQNPSELGVLVVDQVVPNGPAHNLLVVGDIVLEINGHHCTTFISLESTLDGNVDATVNVVVQRGASRVALTLVVQDLHAITPTQFLEVGDSILHPLSYQQGRNYAMAVGGVYATHLGHMLRNANMFSPCLVLSLHGTATPTLDAFLQVFSTLEHGASVDLTYALVGTRHIQYPTVITVDWQWFPITLWTQEGHEWVPQRISPPSGQHLHRQVVAPPTPLKTDAPWATALLQSLVYVRSEAPLEVDGLGGTSFEAIGYVLDADRGYVLVDKSAVHVFMAHVTVCVAGSITVPATIRYLHPVHNFAVVQFDPAQVGHTPTTPVVTSLPIPLVATTPDSATDVAQEQATSEVTCGSGLSFVGLTNLGTVITTSTVVIKIDRLGISDLEVPRFKSGPVEVWTVDAIHASALGGVFVHKGNVVALYLEFSLDDATDADTGNLVAQSVNRAVPFDIMRDVITTIQCGGTPPPSVELMPVEWSTTGLNKASAGLGLTSAWTNRLASKYPDTRQALTVLRCAAHSQASTVLKSGDVVLTVNDQVVVKDLDIDRIVADASRRHRRSKSAPKTSANTADTAPVASPDATATTSSHEDNKTVVTMRVLRQGREVSVDVATTLVSALGTSRIVVWCGLILQPPHFVIYQRGFVPSRVYISLWMEGSPGDKYAMEPRRFVLQVNDIDTPDLDAFLRVVRHVRHGESVRLKVVGLTTAKEEMRTLRTEYRYWPTTQVEWDPLHERWQSTVLTSLDQSTPSNASATK